MMNCLKYVGLFDHSAEGPIPPKVKEIPWAPLISKYLSTLGEISKTFKGKVMREVNDFDFACYDFPVYFLLQYLWWK